MGVNLILGFPFRDAGWETLGLAWPFITWEVTPIDMDSDKKYYVCFSFSGNWRFALDLLVLNMYSKVK